MKAAKCKICGTPHWTYEPHAAPFHMVKTKAAPKDQVALPLAAPLKVASQDESVTVLKPVSKQVRWRRKHPDQYKAHRREYMEEEP